MFNLLKRNKKLGVATGKGRYDLPLNQSAGTGFLIVLVGLMTFLAMMAIVATMAMGSVTKHWSSGLENRLTIEIPAVLENGKIRDASEIDTLSESVQKVLRDNPNIKEFEILSDEDIHGLISPWLGDDATLDNIPLPGLVSVHLHIRDKSKLAQLENSMNAIASDIRLDTHESWLADIISLARSLKISAGIVAFIIAITTVTAIAGAIRSRMAEHKADIELLHLMGASDLYITSQLQRHATLLSLKGSGFGLLGGAIILFLLSLIGGNNTDLLPSFSLGASQTIILLLLPILISAVASQTARFTVLRVLGQMP